MTRLLLDTHAVIWWSIGSPLLSQAAAAAIASPDTLKMVSAASAWEIATKHRLGKLPEADLLARDLDTYLYDQGFEALDVTVAHGRLGGALPSPHRDPFDRLLIAQALLEQLTFVSNETVLDGFGVPRIW